mmetsp:Transcript_56952/g.101069  ORF Transcript_56952/g.101069 Transcript_56952/m.101069 type:complete len:206 (+) Transcript_56952:273-890(+)
MGDLSPFMNCLYQVANSWKDTEPVSEPGTSHQNDFTALSEIGGPDGANCFCMRSMNSSYSIEPLPSVSSASNLAHRLSTSKIDIPRSLPTFLSIWSFAEAMSEVMKSVLSVKRSLPTSLEYHLWNSSKSILPLPSSSTESHIFQACSLFKSLTGVFNSLASSGMNSGGSISPDPSASSMSKIRLTSPKSWMAFREISAVFRLVQS